MTELRDNAKMGSHVPKVQEEVMLFGTMRKLTTWTECVTQSMFWDPITRVISSGGGMRDVVR